MRLIFPALLALLLTACASQGPGTVSSTSPNSAALTTSSSSSPAVDPSIKNATADQTIDVDHNSVKSLTTSDGDLWARIRRGFQIPDLNNDLVAMQINWYVERPEYVQRMTTRSEKYLYHIVEELEERHMPTELALLPFIESAYNPQALSVAKAAGMWQFVPGTGRTYNLKQNMFQDERRDVLASTSAALDYLSKLHDMFGDWQLALAAYNWGEGNVQRAIARNQAQGLPTDYESLRMPNETRNYVPKLQAIKEIVANPKMYGLTLPPIPNHPYFVTVTTSRDIDVNVAAKLAGLSLDEFRSLNPSFSKPVILGVTRPQILLPFENAESFETNLKSYAGTLSTWTTYTVTSRERPAELAAKIGVDASTLMAVNKIPAGMRLKSGSTVLVPKTDDDDEDISADVAENAVLAIEPDVPDTRKVLIRVRRHETMAAVARRYGVSVAQIKRWNKTRRDRLAPGQRVVLHVPVGQRMPAEPAPVREAAAPAVKLERVSAHIGGNRHEAARTERQAGRSSSKGKNGKQAKVAQTKAPSKQAAMRSSATKKTAAKTAGTRTPGKTAVSRAASSKAAEPKQRSTPRETARASSGKRGGSTAAHATERHVDRARPATKAASSSSSKHTKMVAEADRVRTK